MTFCIVSSAVLDMSQQGYDDKDPYGHPRIPFRGHYDRRRCDRRRQWAEEFSSSNLKHMGEWWVGEGEDDSCSCLRLKGNIENPIGKKTQQFVFI